MHCVDQLPYKRLAVYLHNITIVITPCSHDTTKSDLKSGLTTISVCIDTNSGLNGNESGVKPLDVGSLTSEFN